MRGRHSLAGSPGAGATSVPMSNPERVISISSRIAFCVACSVFVVGAACQEQTQPPGRNGQQPYAAHAAPPPALVSENADGTWSAELSATAGEGMVSAFVHFTGPADKTRRMGMCLVQQYGAAPDGVTCSNGEDCGGAPVTLPPGGARYCVAPQDGATRSCHFRPGPGATYCVGTPAIGFAPIAPGEHRLDIEAPAGTWWLALVCFEGCAEIPPLTSATLTVR